MWANGGRMNAANVEMLMSFASLVSHMDAATPSERRAALLTVNDDGRSVLDNFRYQLLERRGLTESELRPDELLGALHGDVSR